MLPGEIAAHAWLPVIERSTWCIDAVKKMRPAYIIATNRRLFESDDNARIVNVDSSALTSDARVMAGSTNRLLVKKLKLPENTICTTRRHSAGTSVTPRI